MMLMIDSFRLLFAQYGGQVFSTVLDVFDTELESMDSSLSSNHRCVPGSKNVINIAQALARTSEIDP